MNTDFFEGVPFSNEDYSKHPLQKADYNSCSFKQCDFSGSDLSEIRFEDCEFIACNLSMVNITNSAFRDVSFRNCKMLGINFDDCSQFGILLRFNECNLSHASFFGGRFRKTIFTKSRLHEVIFTESDVINSVFDECDLSRAVFDQTQLEGTDFRTSYNMTISPNRNRMKRSRFSREAAASLLEEFGIIVE